LHHLAKVRETHHTETAEGMDQRGRLAVIPGVISIVMFRKEGT
jgi:hypothetical protein